jgi:hypothetical protein
MEDAERYKSSYARGNKRWRSPRYGYTSDNCTNIKISIEKDNIAVSRQRKKMKVHKGIPELTITKDDAELVIEKV